MELLKDVVIDIIFPMLSGREICTTCRCVCKKWLRWSKEERLWQRLCEKENLGDKFCGKSWEWLYKSKKNLVKQTLHFTGVGKVEGKYLKDNPNLKNPHPYCNDFYCGDLVSGIQNGIGEYFWDSYNDIYFGEWKNAQKHGQGTYKWLKTGNAHIGQWSHDKRTGKSEFMWFDGRRYNGMLNNGYIEGFGVFIFPDGAVYNGCFYESRRHGYGVMTWTDNTNVEGFWEFDTTLGCLGKTWEDFFLKSNVEQDLHVKFVMQKIKNF